MGDPRSCQLIADYYRRCYEVAIDGDLLAKPTPTEEELKLLDAIQQTPREEWVTDDDGEHPTVAAVALVTGNYRLTKEEIVGVLKKWPLSS
ncbi:hypothetical protein M0R72_08765 [Candidatus Pacearchaeota archaeon]|nr:hypothetical protein [Candidatus Pacearchaeota archaeon]